MNGVYTNILKYNIIIKISIIQRKNKNYFPFNCFNNDNLF